MRLRSLLYVALPVSALYMPLVASAVGIPFFGPIVPPGASTCAAGWMAALDLVNRAIAFALTIGIVFIAPMSIAYAGFLFVVNPVNPSGVSKARSVLLNTIVGIVIALAAWLIVDTVLTVLTAPDKGVSYWTAQLFKGGDVCQLTDTQISNNALNQSAGQKPGDIIGSTPISEGGTGLTSPTQACAGHNGIDSSYDSPENFEGAASGSATSVLCADGTTQSRAVAGPLTSNGDGCDAGMIMQASAAGGYALTQAQANTLACISRPEDACGAGKVTNYNWGKGSSAAGAYQVTMQSHSNCFDNSVCQQAAGSSAALNCGSGFSGGNPKADAASQALVQKCLQAAANVQCSAAAAACLVKARPDFGDWAPYSAGNAACVAKYR